MIVTAETPDITDAERTYLSTFVAKGATSLPVKSNDDFVNGRRILIGQLGDEQAELATISSVAADKLSLGVGATVYDHNSDDPVYMVTYDKIRFYRATSESGTYTLMATVDIDVDDPNGKTNWDDTTSLSSHYYKNSLYNSVTLVETDLSDPIPASGYDEKTVGRIIDIAVRRVRDKNFTVFSPEEYLDIMNEVNGDLLLQAHRPYGFLRRTATLSTVADQAYVALPENLWKFDDMRVGITAGNITQFGPRIPRSAEDFYDRYENTMLQGADGIMDAALDEENRRLLIYPTPKTSQAGIVKMRYYKTFDTFKSMSSKIETPTNLVYVYKLIAAYYTAKSESDRQWAGLAQQYEQKYGTEMVKLQRSNRMDAGSPRSFIGKRYRRNRRYHL